MTKNTIKSRKFQGRVFLVTKVYDTKAKADSFANAMRVKGQLARVRNKHGKWVVYSRAK